MKVVLDTNVFVSGVFFSGPPYQILKAWRDGKIELAVTLEILDEYRRVGEILALGNNNLTSKIEERICLVTHLSFIGD